MSPEDRYEHSHLAWPCRYFDELPCGHPPFSAQDYLSDQDVVQHEFEEQERDCRIRKNAGVKSERFYTDGEGGLVRELQFDQRGRLISSENYRATDWQHPHLRQVSEGENRTWHGESGTLKSLVKVTYQTTQDQTQPAVLERMELLFDEGGNLTRFKQDTEGMAWVIEYHYHENGRYSHARGYEISGADNVERRTLQQTLYDESGRPGLKLDIGEEANRETGYSYDEEGRLNHIITVKLKEQESLDGYFLPDQTLKPLQSAAFQLEWEGRLWKTKFGTKPHSEEFYRYYQNRLAFIDRLEPKTNSYFPRRAYYYDQEGRLLRELYRQKRDYLTAVNLHEYDAEGRKKRLLTIDGRLNDEIDWDRAAILPEDIKSLKKERNEYDLSFSYHASGAIQSIRSDQRISGMSPLAKVDQYHPDGRPHHIWSATFKKNSVQPTESFYEYDHRKLLTHVRTRERKTEDFMRVVREFWD